MAASRKPAVRTRRFRWTFFKQSTELHFFLLLVVADTLYRMVGGDISMGLNALYGIGLFCFVFAPITNMIADLLFKAMEMLTRHGLANRPPQSKTGDPSKGDTLLDKKSRSKRKRPSKGKAKSNSNCQGKESAVTVQSPNTKYSFGGNGLSESSDAPVSASPPAGRSLKNYLASFVPEIRLQIFKYYFASFRPERYYREACYRNIDSMNLLHALKHGRTNQRLYQEALDQYHRSHQLGLLIEGEGVGRGYIDDIKSGVFKLLKDITFGPGTIESLMRPSRVISNSWEVPHSSFDVAERKSRWYRFQTAQLFGGNSRLARLTRGLENITIFMNDLGELEIEHLRNFSTTSSATFPNLKKICYCFPAAFSATESNREYVNTFIFLLILKFGPPGLGNILNFKQHPWNRISYGCQCDVSGLSWAVEDGREIELEFVVYYSQSHIIYQRDWATARGQSQNTKV